MKNRNQMVRVASITRDDCEWTYSRSSGPGGQHRNKTATAVTVRHPPSGAIGHAAESKSQWQNRQAAWRRMAESEAMQRWVKMEAGHALRAVSEIASSVQVQLQPSNLKVEVKRNGQWVEATKDDFQV